MPTLGCLTFGLDSTHPDCLEVRISWESKLLLSKCYAWLQWVRPLDLIKACVLPQDLVTDPMLKFLIFLDIPPFSTCSIIFQYSYSGHLAKHMRNWTCEGRCPEQDFAMKTLYYTSAVSNKPSGKYKLEFRFLIGHDRTRNPKWAVFDPKGELPSSNIFNSTTGAIMKSQN